MLRANGLSKNYGENVVLSEVSLFVGPGERIGLVGANGVGKTTLLRLMAGEESPDSGELLLEGRKIRVRLLPQEIEPLEGGTVLENILEVRAELPAMEAEMRRLEEQMSGFADGDDSDDLLKRQQRYGELQERFESEGGFSYEADAKSILSGLGFTGEDHQRPLSSLSGGWRMRLALARILFDRPDLLLLDEPTNHLDLSSTVWLEEHLLDYPGTYILISHDRWLLNRLTRRTIELARGQLAVYSGNYDFYLRERARRREILLASKKRQDQRIRQIEDFIARNRVRKDRARQAQSRMKMLDKIERIEVAGEEKKVRFSFPQPGRSGQDVMRLDGVTKRYGSKTIYSGLDLLIRRGEKIALVGDNGAGKSTLLKILAGVLPFEAGERQPGHNVDLYYYAQHQLEALDPGRTALEELLSHADITTAPMVRDILGAFRFSGNDVDVKVAVLSGGEKSRLALARMLLKPASLILMDEPTNHLDMASRDVLEQALRQHQGTLCFISHDRYFINRVATRVIHVEHGRLINFPGNYDYFLEKSGRGDIGRPAAAVAAPAPASLRPAKSPREGGEIQRRAQRRSEAERRNRQYRATAEYRKRVEAFEAAIDTMERKRSEIEAQMAEPAVFADGGKMKDLTGTLNRMTGDLARLYDCWEQAGADLETAVQACSAADPENPGPPSG
jgi:ATP-binding cassette subfamily F protein 3